MKPRTAVVVVSMALTTLVVTLVAPSRVSARGRWQDVLSPAGSRSSARYGAPAAPAPRATTERVRSAAPPEASPSNDSTSPPPFRAVRSPRELEHAAGDRLRQALAAAQDDPHSAARIRRLIADAASEARRNKALGERVWYWRDPFSANPRQPIVLSLEVQLEMQLWAAQQEAVRAHMASNSARVEAATAHAEAARARVEAARAQEAADKARPKISRQSDSRQNDARPNGSRQGDARPDGARHDARSARDADDRALLAALSPRRANVGAAPDGGEASEEAAGRRRVARRTLAAKTALARNESAAGPSNRHRDIGAARAVVAPAPAGGGEEPATDPKAWRSSDPRGIVIVPINTSAPPVAALPRHR